MFALSAFSWILFIASFHLVLAKSPYAIGLTQVTCELSDNNFAIIKRCNLTKTADGLRALNIHIHPLQSLDHVSLKLSLFRKTNKNYNPFFVESTVDVCDFLQDYKQNIPWGMIYEKIAKYTNINHSCPYNHDLIIEKLIISPRGLKMVPIPKGEYIVNLKIISDKVQKLISQIFFKRYF
ncbi:uncharacterized protein LOC106091593 [Stomoxys calcitrans]|uniref:MD-2-related lipid-recognition domain-containing protein n=1 Tax=Stomoxys calcitrans TaxID=35570 RepID=A0A1I8PQE2_STOCA|nr:uncharacterized protein LOC106091593 [Stomoxys calcitrans]XP_059216759.1 uncharacterized protein LOC106091593 [Stomoxys calcitrans]